MCHRCRIRFPRCHCNSLRSLTHSNHSRLTLRNCISKLSPQQSQSFLTSSVSIETVLNLQSFKPMRLLALAIVIFFTSPSYAENLCEQTHCPQGRLPIEVCFVHPDVYGNPLWRLSIQAPCRNAHETHIVTSRAEFLLTLNKINRQCKTVIKSTFNGHGTPGVQQMGSLSFDSAMDDLKPYSCIFEPYLPVHINGCNNGNGCFSDILLLKLGHSLFSQGVRLTAPTTYATTLLPGIMPHTSLNLKNRKLLIDPSSLPQETWMQEGLTRGNGGTIADRCGGELQSSLDRLKSAIDRAKKNNCDHHFRIPPIRHREMQDLADHAKRLAYYEDLSEEKIKILKDQQSYIKRATEYLMSCRAQ